MNDSDDYLKKFTDLAAAQGMISDLSYDEVAQAMTRAELGISSLNIILLLSAYMKENADPGLAFKPEWVTRLERIEGIVSVMREMDQSRHGNAAVP